MTLHDLRPAERAVEVPKRGEIAGTKSDHIGQGSGGTYAISTAPHANTQRWARSIVEAFPNFDGVRYDSRFAGHVCAALFPPARTAMPSRPALSLPLTHPELASRLAGAARRLGYLVI